MSGSKPRMAVLFRNHAYVLAPFPRILNDIIQKLNQGKKLHENQITAFTA